MIKLKPCDKGVYWIILLGPKSITDILIITEERSKVRHTEMIREDEGRGWSRVATNTGSHQKLEEARNGRSPRALEGVQPCRRLDFGPVILILGSCPPEWRENTFLLF